MVDLLFLWMGCDMGILCRLNQVPSSVDTLLDSFPFLSLQVSRFHDSKATHGDVTPDNLPGQKFLYGYDDIGNREAVTVYGDPNDPNEARTATYTPNLLNQYTQRDVSGAIHAMAWADPNDAVAFDRATDPNNPQTGDAYGDYFYRQFLADNSANAFFDSIETLVNGQPAGGQDAYLAATPEEFTYDEDGNLIEDGRWSYRYDGENRLVAMEASDPNTAVGPALRLAFSYDYKGRRTAKVVYGWSGSAWTLAATTRFAWDGWLMAAELGPDNSPTRAYAWGPGPLGQPRGRGRDRRVGVCADLAGAGRLDGRRAGVRRQRESGRAAGCFRWRSQRRGVGRQLPVRSVREPADQRRRGGGGVSAAVFEQVHRRRDRPCVLWVSVL